MRGRCHEWLSGQGAPPPILIVLDSLEAVRALTGSEPRLRWECRSRPTPDGEDAVECGVHGNSTAERGSRELVVEQAGRSRRLLI